MTRQLAARAGLVLLLWLLGGRVGLLVGLVVALWDQFWTPSPALILRAALLGFCLLPLAVLLRGLPTPTTVTPLFAGSNLVAHYLAGTALALLVLGILRDVRPAPRASGPGNGPPPPGADDLLAPLPPPPARELPAPDGGAGAGGNGARELQPPTPALPSATHPPLWAPGRRAGDAASARQAGGTEQPAGTEQAPEEATEPASAAGPEPPAGDVGTASAPPTHPPLWDPARRRAGDTLRAGDTEQPAEESARQPPERAPLGPLTGRRPERDTAAGQPASPTPEGGPAAPPDQPEPPAQETTQQPSESDPAGGPADRPEHADRPPSQEGEQGSDR
jgi:hypothetical protein